MILPNINISHNCATSVSFTFLDILEKDISLSERKTVFTENYSIIQSWNYLEMC